MLSEVLREREAQIKYKKKRQDLMKNQDEKYIQQQQQVNRWSVDLPQLLISYMQDRENGILVDMKAAEERAKEKRVIANFQQVQ